MRHDDVVIGREYRLRYSRHPRVRVMSEVTIHTEGRIRRQLKVELLDEDTGKPLDGEAQRIQAGELLGPWDDHIERERRERNRERDRAMAALEEWLDEVGIGAHVGPKRGSQSKILVELEPRQAKALIERKAT